jgi:hypothetical protein
MRSFQVSQPNCMSRSKWMELSGKVRPVVIEVLRE